MLTIIATVFWIIFDVVVSIVTALVLPNWEWWLLVGSGAVLAIGTFVGGLLDRRLHAAEQARIAAGQERHSQEHNVLAQGSIAILARLANVDDATASPDAIIQGAISKIENLERQVAEVQRGQGPRLSPQQRDLLDAAIREIQKETRLAFTLCHYWLEDEAAQYAHQFAQVFVPLGVTGVPVGIHENIGDGLVIRIKDHNAPVPIPPNAMRLSEALTRAGIQHRFADRAPLLPGAPLPDDYFDLAVGRKSENENSN